jgi:hypothetical protein
MMLEGELPKQVSHGTIGQYFKLEGYIVLKMFSSGVLNYILISCYKITIIVTVRFVF